jgi:hypothetical protein
MANTIQTTFFKRFTFYPILFIGVACVLLLLLTIFSRRGIRINTFLAMMAVSGMFGMTMVAFSLELEKELTWKVIWKPFTIAVAISIVLVVAGWLVELGKPDLVAE